MKRRRIKRSWVFVYALITMFATGAQANWHFDWKEMAVLPPETGSEESLGVAAPFSGVHNDGLIIAGGANFAKPYWQTEKVWHDDIRVLVREGDDDTWVEGFKLDKPLAYGASVSTPHGVLCIGGNDAERSYDAVFLLTWDPVQKKIGKHDLPSLPSPCSLTSAAMIGSKVYVAGGIEGTDLTTAMNNFWVLDMSNFDDPSNLKWTVLPSWPGPARAVNITAAQHNGKTDCIYVISGRMQHSQDPSSVEFLKDVYEFSPKQYLALQKSGTDQQDSAWKKRADLPVSVCAASAASVGQSHIFVFSGDDGSLFLKAAEMKDDHPGFSKDILAYHTITNTWFKSGELPYGPVTTTALKWGDNVVIASGEVRPRVRTPKIIEGHIVSGKSTFGAFNFSVLILYLLAMVGIGVYFTGRNKNTDDYFRGGQRLPAWAAGLSIFATVLSSITFVAIPAKAFAEDWTFFMVNMMSIAVAPFVMIFVIPFFRRIDATSAYEYLEKRFNAVARLFAATSYVLFQIGRMAIVMFLPAIALATITPLSVHQCILVMGVLSVIYCTMGGLQAVVWTDAIQTFVLLGGALLSLILMIASIDADFASIVTTVQSEGKFNLVKWDFSSTSYMTTAIWVMVIGGIGQFLIPYISDQGVVQRYLSTKDVKSAQKTALTNAILTFPASIIFFSVGTALFFFYRANPDKLDPGYQNDAVFPLFIANELPVGIAGLVVAGIFAAAQSTVSTSMNSISTVVTTDFIRRFSLLKTERGYFNIARLFTVLFGAAGTGLALLLASADIKSLLDSYIAMMGLIAGAMCGLFLLGIFTTRVQGTAAVGGAIIGAFGLFLIQRYTAVSFQLNASIGIGLCVLAGYVLSWILHERPKDLTGLTLSDLRNSKKTPGPGRDGDLDKTS